MENVPKVSKIKTFNDVNEDYPKIHSNQNISMLLQNNFWTSWFPNANLPHLPCDLDMFSLFLFFKVPIKLAYLSVLELKKKKKETC